MSLKPFAVLTVCLMTVGTAWAQSSDLVVKDVWARATPGNAETAAAYATIVSTASDRLISASSPVAKTVELHTMSMDGGVMKMRPLAGVELPAGQPVVLSPGGMHIMLLGFVRPLREGQSFPLTLTFEKAGPRQVAVPIKKVGAMGPDGRAGVAKPMDMPMHQHH